VAPRCAERDAADRRAGAAAAQQGLDHEAIHEGKSGGQTPAQTTISSPLIADGKLRAMANSGNSLLMISTDPKAYTSLGRATVKAQWVPSPSIVNGKLVLRMKDKVKVWALTL
jgi:hypothetical protein